MSNESYRPVSVEELGVQIIRFTKRNALLEGVRRGALTSAYRQVAMLARISAMARATARSGVSEADRTAIAAGLREACEQVEREARANLASLKFTTPRDGEDGPVWDALSPWPTDGSGCSA
ncbi:hypothetical protein R75461_07661 [Paraburkholderia nemoris]|uniref:hypothetical protein n=1 Tax=Paraburkholderia nemoris TaxID=2793076 RepID=UPI00190DE4FB|nr:MULTISPECIES: hypothetical protein [Paraburkholderia]MBK3786392.1 hypothetical protein [Paraburkholderia aspalathi]CAE6854932.1 hypothetical protein R75461_07661 [Paraburkholderia nemoris]